MVSGTSLSPLRVSPGFAPDSLPESLGRAGTGDHNFHAKTTVPGTTVQVVPGTGSISALRSAGDYFAVAMPSDGKK